MSVAITDMKFRKSAAVSDTGANGGRKGNIEVLTGVRHNLFPRVTKSERLLGVIRYRKEFFCNDNSLNEAAYAALMYLEAPSNAGDRYYVAKGTHTDTQADIIAAPPVWTGVGTLAPLGNLNGQGGEYAVQIVMESSDYQFQNGGVLHITNKVKLNQQLSGTVNIGDSVQYDSTSLKWAKIGYTSNITYPKGLYMGSLKIMTIESTTSEDFLVIADNLYSAEEIGLQAGSGTTVPLSTLAHKGNGICSQPGKLPVVTAIVGNVEKTVNISQTGIASGFCTAGELNMTTGTWIVPIAWSTAPDNGTAITVTYHENCYSYVGNTVTVQLNEAVPHPYATGTTLVGGCVEGGDVCPTVQSVAVVSPVGTFNASGANPPQVYNLGTSDDTITVTFTSATNFTVSGLYAGNMGTGTTLTDYSFNNPASSVPYIKLLSASWGGTWAAGNTLTIVTASASAPIWFKEVVPAGISPESYNLLPLGWYCE